MLKDFEREQLSEIIEEWTVEQIENYIARLDARMIQINDYIKFLRTIKKKKTPKKPLETGPRDGR